ncbi:MAG: phosphate starvation-inducible protein PhoH, partial [Arcobacter sp.]|nr:phosphate starvation-inducible protein PhoH [Arcobacter sp.]
MNFDKYYVLDTNILLEDASNVYKLSQEGRNLIILPETVLDEIDTKKSGFDEINFQAREFARILENSSIINSIKKDSYK